MLPNVNHLLANVSEGCNRLRYYQDQGRTRRDVTIGILLLASDPELSSLLGVRLY
jgi:hypothetical protein